MLEGERKMTSRDFCCWLQGFFELQSACQTDNGLNQKQITMIQNHLKTVFKTEIDPSFKPIHIQELNELHSPMGEQYTFEARKALGEKMR